MTVCPAVLIVASRFDFSCDYVVLKLKERGIAYLRLNSEDLESWDISLNPVSEHMTLRREEFNFEITPDALKAVWFRRACYPRDYAFWQLPVAEQMKRGQWSAFLRSLLVYEDCIWMNRPDRTYRAEQKALQLKLASKIGFSVPQTLFTNSVVQLEEIRGESVALKGVDTVIAYEAGKEYFGFTNVIRKAALNPENLESMPVTVQELLSPKRDLRVTVVRDRVFTAEILCRGNSIEGDWRVQKSGLEYISHQLPREVEEQCIQLLRDFDLSFGGIDLALTADGYQFIEINPTGEWAWLVDTANLPIDGAIADVLLGG